MVQNNCAIGQFGKILQLKRFFNHVLRAGNFQTLSNFSPRKFPVFHFSYPEELLVLFFSREIGSLWTVALNIRVLAEKFSTVFSRVPSRCERERSCFFWLLNFFLLEPENVLSNIGLKTRHFSQRSKILVRRNSLPSFARENVFHFSTLGEKSFRLLWARNLSDSENNFSEKNTQFFIFCVQRTFWYFSPEI